jgi:hypothetical protein
MRRESDLAEAVHALSLRPSCPLVRVGCSGTRGHPEGLWETILTGVEIVVATESGADGLAGRRVDTLAADDGCVWAIVEGQEVWRRESDGWERIAGWDGPRLTCLHPRRSGLMLGSAEAHLLHLSDGVVEQDDAFEEAPGRSSWYTPWGGPADTRSIASEDGTTFVNVHVGGVMKSDGGSSWVPLVDIDVDVHQVATAPDGSVLLATGSSGFGRSTDQGSTWRWDSTGLHSSYCRAVAVTGDHVLLSASTGPHGGSGALYRRRLGSEDRWERVSEMVQGNIDTHCLVTVGRSAAFVTEDGVLWASQDEGASWAVMGDKHRQPRSVALV